MDLHEIQLGLAKIAQGAHAKYLNYEKAKAKFESLEKQDKTVIAIEAGKWTGSESLRNRQALASDAYSVHLLGLEAARMEKCQAYAEIKAMEAELACYQSLSKNYLKENEATHKFIP